ncbi:uncharacterized protein METZ01_LOCUS337106 [marine metagenome]|uniref:Uncharacterized protein n=1 Tax=marine metagenome TaxID=408172 RepID=A0A382QHT8_9ZZZZ
MQFADGELDESLTAEIEAARIHDKELQSYLEVYETTRSALISVNENEEIPSHINHLIDNFVPEKKQNWLTRLVKKNPFKTSIFSAILASIITLQVPLGILTGTTMAPQMMARGVNIAPDNNVLLMNVNNDNNEVFEASKSESSTSSAYRVPANAEEIGRQLLKALSINPETKEVIIQLEDENIIFIVDGVEAFK